MSNASSASSSTAPLNPILPVESKRGAVEASRALRLLKESLVSHFGFTLRPEEDTISSLLVDVQCNHQPWFSLTLYDPDVNRDTIAERPVIRELVLEHARSQRDVLTDEVTCLLHWVKVAPTPCKKRRGRSSGPGAKRGPAAAAVAVPEIDPDQEADFTGGYSFPTLMLGSDAPYLKLVRRHAHLKLVVYAHVVPSFEQ